MEEKQTINIRPTTYIYSFFKKLGYKPGTSIAEFIDNSTQSYFDNIDELKKISSKGLVINIEYSTHSVRGDELVISDNAFGMDFAGLKKALKLGNVENKKNKRNEFGMGLKTAACWFGDFWTIETTQLGSDKKYTVSIDIEKLKFENVETINYKTENIDVNEHYTKITINKITHKISSQKTKIIDFLINTFRIDLKREDFNIFYNGNQLEATEIEPYVDKFGKVWKTYISFNIDHDGKELNVHGFVGRRKNGMMENKGFVLIRRGRAIQPSYKPKDLFGSGNHLKQQRLYGELHMDNWPVTQAKDDIEWNDNLESIFIEKIAEITKPYIKCASLTSANIDEFIENYHRENNPDFKILIQNNETKEKNICTEIEDHNNFDTDDVNKPKINFDDKKNVSEKQEFKSVQPSKIIHVEKPKNYEFTQSNKICVSKNNQDYCFDTTEHSNSDANIVELRQNNEIYINFNHPFLQKYKNNHEVLKPLIQLIVSICLSEIESREFLVSNENSNDGLIEPTKIRRLLNEILRNWNDNN